MGAAAARPWRRHLPEPARPQRHRPGRGDARVRARGGTGARSRAQRVGRGGRGRRGPPRARERQPGPAHRRGRGDRPRCAKVLSRSEPLPFALDGKAEVSEEVRLRYRYLDLRRPELQQQLPAPPPGDARGPRNYFHEHGFVDVETPILTKSTPEGARDFLVPSPRAPRQLLRPAAVAAALQADPHGGRASSATSRSPAASATRTCAPTASPSSPRSTWRCPSPRRRTSIELIEGLFAADLPAGRHPAADALPAHDLRRGHGALRQRPAGPPLRAGDRGPHRASGAAAASAASRRRWPRAECIRGFAVPGAAEASRKQVDGWSEIARRSGAAGVLTLRRKGGRAHLPGEERALPRRSSKARPRPWGWKRAGSR